MNITEIEEQASIRRIKEVQNLLRYGLVFGLADALKMIYPRPKIHVIGKSPI